MDWMFRTLDPQEEVTFRKWARDNHQPGDEIDSLWHPVVRDECAKIDAEFEALPISDDTDECSACNEAGTWCNACMEESAQADNAARASAIAPEEA